MNKVIFLTVVFVIALVLGVLIYMAVRQSKSEHYNAFVNVQIQCTPAVANVGQQLYSTRLTSFFGKYFPNSMITVVDINQNAVSAPFLAQIVFTSADNKQLAVVPIASSAWYKTQHLSLAQMEDAIYANPRVIEAMQKIVAM